MCISFYKRLLLDVVLHKTQKSSLSGSFSLNKDKQRTLNKLLKALPLGAKLACSKYVAFLWSGSNDN